MNINTTEKARHAGLRAIAQSQRGFTLLEIMIVIIIIGSIAGLVGFNVIQRLEESKIETAGIQMSTFDDALELFYAKYSEFPATAESLQVLVPDYIKSLPLDPWQQPYMYVCEDGRNYLLWSNGPDKLPKTEDDVLPK